MKLKYMLQGKQPTNYFVLPFEGLKLEKTHVEELGKTALGCSRSLCEWLGLCDLLEDLKGSKG